MIPSLVFILPILAAAIAWSIPGGNGFLRGFWLRAEPSLPGVALLIVWYMLCLASIHAGSRAGGAVRPVAHVEAAGRDPIFERHFYFAISVAATIGVLAALFAATQSVSIIGVLSNNAGNQLSESLEGRAGLETLRYASAISAPIGLYLAMRRRATWWSALWNVSLLLTNALFTSRLSLILAVVVFAYILATFDREFRLRGKFLIVSGAAMFAILTFLNYVRNANFYRELGVDNPIEMNFWQIVTYLGTPFQASIGVATSITDRGYVEDSGPGRAVDLLLPGFIRSSSDVSTERGAKRYGYFVDVNSSLTTNSAFADTFAIYGSWGLAASLVLMAVAGFIYGHARQYQSLVSVASGIVLYGFAEYWRILLFNKGIIIFLILMIVVATVYATVASSRHHSTRRSMRDGR